MPSDVNEGRGGPRWPTVCALALKILVVAPMALWIAAGTGRLPFADTSLLVPVVRPADAAVAAVAAPVPEPAAPAELRVDAATLLDILRGQDYRIEDVRRGGQGVPRVRLASMPRDMGDLVSPDERKVLFVKTMLPLVLMANERIERDRVRLQRLHALKSAGYSLSPNDRRWLAGLADRYGLAGNGDPDTLLLLRRVDIVPVSLTLAQAAEESGWGTSRFAQEGNALFGQLTWSDRHDGIVPRNRQAGETHRFRSFDDLSASVEAYMHNLNTHRAYNDFRRARATMRRSGDGTLDGYKLAAHIVSYSERGADYIRAVRGLIRANDLHEFDRAVLVKGGRETVLRVAPTVEQVDGVGPVLVPPAKPGRLS